MRFRWPISFKSIGDVDTKSESLGLSDSLGSFLNFGADGAYSPSSALRLYRKSTAVSIPVNMIADSFASIVPVIKKGDEIISSHPVLDLLNNPSPYFTRTLFFEALAKNYLITGEAFITALGNTSRPPLELQPLSSGNVSVNQGAGGMAESFIVSGNTLPGIYNKKTNKKSVRYTDGPLREIKQIRNFSTYDNSLIRGQSQLVSAAKEVRQHILGNDHNVSLLEKGGRVSLVFHFEEDMNLDSFEETKRRVREQYGGAQNAGEIGVTAGGKLDIKEAGTNNKDMDFAILQEMAKQACALQYKVPLPLVTTSATTFNNYKEAKLALYDDAVLPLADRQFGALTNMLMPRFGLDPRQYIITYDMDKITALAIRRNEELKLRRGLNLETINEMRSMIGRESVDGGDVVLAPANLVPVGIDLFTTDDPTIGLARDSGDDN